MITAAQLPIEDGVGVVGFTVYGPDLTQVAARTTAGVTRMFQGAGFGEYAAVVEFPDGVTELLVIWDDESGNSARDYVSSGGSSSVGPLTIEVG